MSLGKSVRLNRLFSHPSGQLCSVAVDHFIGYQRGLPAGLGDLPRTLAAVVAGQPDAVTMHPGMASAVWGPYAGKVPLILQSIIGRPDDSADEQWAVPEDAIRLGADAFATCAFVRGPTEAMHLNRTAEIVRRADALAVPVILHIYPRSYSANSNGEVTISNDPEDIAWAVRCGLEAGVDVIKTPFTGDRASFRDIVSSCPLPVVVAGGPKTNTIEESLDQIRAAMQAGARGATVGRNIWGAVDVTGAVERFKAVVHGERTDELTTTG